MAIAKSVAGIVQLLEPDPWRLENAFTSDLSATQAELYRPGLSEEEAARILNAWIQKYQPCIFGRLAAQAGLISYCILNEADLIKSDEHLQEKIQAARLRWLKDANYGGKSAFVILAVSERLAAASPNAVVLALAKRLCFLYLEDEIQEDKVYLDEVFLEKPGQTRTVWRWYVGANFFSAHGDGRWWHDHRIPGGIGFSMNSVGHLVKAASLAPARRFVEAALGAPGENWTASKVDSLEMALRHAMQTIAGASPTISGKATELLPLPEDTTNLPVNKCPFELPAHLANKNFCTYKGYYHTDYTIPAEYFRPDVVRPADAPSFELDFTYLFHKGVDNPAHMTMGEGRRIAAGTQTVAGAQPSDLNLAKVYEHLVEQDKQERLKKALGM